VDDFLLSGSATCCAATSLREAFPRFLRWRLYSHVSPNSGKENHQPPALEEHDAASQPLPTQCAHGVFPSHFVPANFSIFSPHDRKDSSTQLITLITSSAYSSANWTRRTRLCDTTWLHGDVVVRSTSGRHGRLIESFSEAVLEAVAVQWARSIGLFE